MTGTSNDQYSPASSCGSFVPNVRKSSIYNRRVYKTEILSTQLLYGYVKYQVMFHN